MSRSARLNLAFLLTFAGLLLAFVGFQFTSWLSEELEREPGPVFNAEIKAVSVGDDRCSIKWSAPPNAPVEPRCVAPESCGAMVHCDQAADLKEGDTVELEVVEDSVRPTATLPSRDALEFRRYLAIAGGVLGVLMTIASILLFRSVFSAGKDARTT